ncbi:hypothetical protein HAX54_029061 [Datura stramonium]|uniref:Uncharacterized protein n=1 Tax=Datura stramonium TaxID=4076 RepID=A0ABS8V5P9_DATST|nr:hypothetical protein [Datura stramonium]
MGFHSRYQQANKGYWYPRDENQCWNSNCTIESTSLGSDEPSYSCIERMLEMVLERVVSTNSGIQQLKSDLLDLTQTVKDHAVSIRHLDERMDLLASKMEARESMKTHEQMKENTTLSQEMLMRKI